MFDWFFLCVVFIHEEYVIGLNVDFPSNVLRNDCFDNLDIVENVVDYLFVIDLYQFLLHIFIVTLVMFHLLQGKILSFLLFQLLFFVVIIQVVYFY